ncbi:hypothetical protein EV421DRAFT_1803584 [Armillaria borealis]|uniref:Uncharacterized protein n=1 Tax=Armillaria borealis TaxID=47425 RepID=A0AA39MRD3_9AGAR|nr:hypothetical protein EV421DRAFT_1803584 [Armillaria borealis]
MPIQRCWYRLVRHNTHDITLVKAKGPDRLSCFLKSKTSRGERFFELLEGRTACLSMRVREGIKDQARIRTIQGIFGGAPFDGGSAWTLHHSFHPSPSLLFSVTESSWRLRLGKQPLSFAPQEGQLASKGTRRGGIFPIERRNPNPREGTHQDQGMEIPSQPGIRKLVVSVSKKGKTPTCLSPAIKLRDRIYAIGVFGTRISFTSYCAQRRTVYHRTSNVRIYIHLFAFSGSGGKKLWDSIIWPCML